MGDVRPGDVLPPLERVVLREDVKTYADVGGDDNPLHQDDAAARSAGFPGVIAHGMFTMGHLAACVVSWAGDPGAVTRLTAQFRAPVYLGETIVAGGTVRSVDADAKTATIDTWVTVERDGETLWPVKKGEAVVRLA